MTHIAPFLGEKDWKGPGEPRNAVGILIPPVEGIPGPVAGMPGIIEPFNMEEKTDERKCPQETNNKHVNTQQWKFL